jgi:capsular exopolysaccharide synthesis family protein
MDEHFQGEQIREEEIHLRDYLQILLKRKHIVITFFIVTVVAVLISTMTKTPLYQASTQILIEKSNNIELSSRYGSSPYDPYFLDTQFELIKSKNVMNRVVKSLNLDTTYRNQFFTDKSGFSLLLTVKEWMSSFSKIILPAKKTASSGEEEIKDPDILTDSDIISSMLADEISVAPIRETNIASIRYLHKNPVIAKMVCNEIAISYMAELLEIKMHTSNYTLAWMTKKAEEEKQKLQDTEQAIQTYTRENDIVTIEDKIAITPQQLTDYSAQLSRARSKRKEIGDVYNQIIKLGTNYKAIENLPFFANNTNLQQLNEKILLNEQKITELSKQFGEKHPTMIKIKEDLIHLDTEKMNIIKRFIESTKNEYELAKKSETNVEQLLDETKNQTLNMNEKLIQYNILKREVDTGRILYQALIQQIKERSATDQTHKVDVSIIEKADTPLAPVTPRKSRNFTLAIVLGLFGGIGIAFFVEYLDNTISSINDLEDRFGLPVLGIIEQVKEDTDSITDIINTRPDSSIVESYRMVRSAIMLSSPEKVPKTILITSSIQGEGKTSTCVNLAKTLCMEGKSVLIMDCDLRRPTIHKIMNIENNFGLSTYLAGISKENIITSLSEEKLSIIPSGPIPPNPAELLNSHRMKKMIGVLAPKFDYILLDSAPMLSVTDTYILNTIVDATILVVKADSTTIELMGSTIKKLHSINAHLIGAVLNSKAKKKSAGYYYSGYYIDDYLDKRQKSSRS